MSNWSPRVRLLSALVAAVVALTAAVAVSGLTSAAASTTTTAAAARPITTKTTTTRSTTTTTVSSTRTTATSTSPSNPATTTSTTATTCAAPTVYQGQSYCTGYVIGVRNTAYGTDARIVLRGVTVVGVTGTKVTVEGGPSCLSGTICGATLPTAVAEFTGLSAVPTYGDVIDLYGITAPGTITAKGYTFLRHCDPDFGC